jgi:hypothetical protein
MVRIISVALLFCAAALLCINALARDKKLPSGVASNEVVALTATALDEDELQQIFSSDFGKAYVVLEVTLTPKGGNPLDVRLDDFLLRSDSTASHTGPLAAAQIAGTETLIVHQTEPRSSRGGFSGGFGGIVSTGSSGAPQPPPNSKVELKQSDQRDPMLDVLKRKILVEKPINETVTGLLFFPLEKEKIKNLTLIYTTPPGKLRIRFK